MTNITPTWYDDYQSEEPDSSQRFNESVLEMFSKVVSLS